MKQEKTLFNEEKRKAYSSPSSQVFQIQMEQIVCASDFNASANNELFDDPEFFVW